MEHLTVHNRINFKSHFNSAGFIRIKRVDHYGHYATKTNYKSFDIPFWTELNGGAHDIKTIAFNNKF